MADTDQRAANATLERLFGLMVRIRAVEEALLRLFAEGRLRGTVHTCLGQEAIAAGVVSALDPRCDVVCSNHRGHGHFLAHTGDVRGLIAEIMGRADGVCGGVGGSQHLFARGFYSNGILGGMTAVATGMALAEKLRVSGAVVAVFLGDGAFGEGVVYEAMNLAALLTLPVVFAVEHNEYAQSTPTALEQSGRLEARAMPFGIATRDVDGNDVLAVGRAAGDAVARVRTGSGPALLFLRTYRLGPHSKGDDSRDPSEIERHRADDPIARARALLDRERATAIESDVRRDVDAVVDELRGAPVIVPAAAGSGA